MWGPRCKMFSHGPMSGARGPKVLFGTYSHMQKVQNWDRGAMAPVAPLNLLLQWVLDVGQAVCIPQIYITYLHLTLAVL